MTERFWTRLFFAAFAPVTGDPSSSIVGLIDVSDRVRAQDMLAKVQAEMAHAARRVGPRRVDRVNRPRSQSAPDRHSK